MASAKQIEKWAREVRPNARQVRVHLRKDSVTISVDGDTAVLPGRAFGFAQVAQALLDLGPSCAEEGAERKD